MPKKKSGKEEKCYNSADAYKIFQSILSYESEELQRQEHFWVMGIDDAGHVVCVYLAAVSPKKITEMTPLARLCTVGKIFSTAIAHKAKKVIISHNKASGTAGGLDITSVQL